MHGYSILAILILKHANGAVIDLAHAYRNRTTCWDTNERFDTFAEITGPKDDWYAIQSFAMSEHCGTHMDAPYHFNLHGWKLDKIPLERMIAEGVHVNVSHEVNGNRDFLLTADHLKAWERKNGPLPHRSVILVNFGWARMFDDRLSYYGTEKEPYRFPGLSEDAAKWIVNSGKVYGVGVDGPSVDPGSQTKAHKIFSNVNMFLLENIALNGTTLPPRGFKLIVQPVKIVGGTGAPARVLAFTSSIMI